MTPSPTSPSAYDSSTPVSALATAGSVDAGNFEQYGLDANGNVTSLRTRRGETLTLTYDNLNRLISKIVPERSGLDPTDTRDVYYGYDLVGDLTAAQFDSVGGEGITFGYDALGRKLTEKQSMDGYPRTITSGYDAANVRSTLTYPDGNYIAFFRDSLERLDYAQSNNNWPLFRTVYNAAGELSGLWRWNLSAGAWSQPNGFGYDTVHRLTTMTQDLAGGSYDSTTTFTLNPASQITSSSRSNDLYAWNGTTALSRSYMANGLNQYSSATSTVAGIPSTINYAFDADGNLSSDGSNSYVYDVENRLVSATFNNATTSLRYDPLGRLYEVNGNSTGITRFLYDGDDLDYGDTCNNPVIDPLR